MCSIRFEPSSAIKDWQPEVISLSVSGSKVHDNHPVELGKQDKPHASGQTFIIIIILTNS